MNPLFLTQLQCTENILQSIYQGCNGTQTWRVGTYLGFDVTVRYGFGTAGGKTKHKIAFLIIKQWFTEQIVLSLNKFNYNKFFLGIKIYLSLCTKL